MCLARHANSGSKLLLEKKITHLLKVLWIYPCISTNANNYFCDSLQLLAIYLCMYMSMWLRVCLHYIFSETTLFENFLNLKSINQIFSCNEKTTFL